MVEVGLLAAFVAGVLSISSPCVLPLLPLYVARLAGVGVGGRPPERRVVFTHAVAFVLGFGVIFVLLGVSLGALGGVMLSYRDWVVRLGGLFMLVTGLHLIGVLRLSFMDREYRARLPGVGSVGSSASVPASFLIGVSFAAGWTPCAGPILGAIFTLAIGGAEPARSGLLFAAYAAGLAVPFLLTAGALGRIDRRLRRLGAWMNVGSGAMLTAVGVLMMLGIYQQAFTRIVGAAPWLPWEPTI